MYQTRARPRAGKDYDVLTLKLEQNALGDVAELEMALVPVIVRMERTSDRGGSRQARSDSQPDEGGERDADDRAARSARRSVVSRVGDSHNVAKCASWRAFQCSF